MRPLRACLTLLFAALLLAACGSGETPSPATAAAQSPGGPSGSPVISAQPGSAGPSASRSAAPSVKASGSPAASKPAGSSAASAPAGSIDPTACAGSDANRAFFKDVAASVAWDVYCPTLAKAWFVEAGSFRAASGGSMVISYKTTTGLRIELKEGAICTGTASECAQMDTGLGSAAFGDRVGQLGKLAGNLVLYVSAGATPAWQATGSGLDEASFRAICTGLLKVPG